MTFGPLTSPGWVAAHVRHGGLHIVDCRWYLADPNRARNEYEASHIRGATFMDLEADLSSRTGAGRHPLPDPEVFAATLGSHGISADCPVVAYDDAGGTVAARLWWMLRDLGHSEVAVLDGGLQAVPAELLTDEIPTPAPLRYIGRPGQMPKIDRDGVRAALGKDVLLDARAAERYRGDSEPVDPKAGHIPTAFSASGTGNLAEDHHFKPPEELRQRFLDLGVHGGGDTICYCGSGVSACHDILAMEVAGLGTATLYPGSWSDWSTADLPIATGPEPGSPPAS